MGIALICWRSHYSENMRIVVAQLIKMTRITDKIHPGISSQVTLLVTENTSDLSMTGVKPANPLYGPYQVYLMLEAGAYLQQVGSANPSPAELIIAFDDQKPNQILGFLLYQLVGGVYGESSVNYTAVREGSRRLGIMRMMFSEMLRHHPASSLSCQEELVPVYERLGFKVDGHRESHITMSIGHPSGGAVASFTGDISSHPLIVMAREEALKIFGPERMRRELANQQITIEFGIESAKKVSADRIAFYASREN